MKRLSAIRLIVFIFLIGGLLSTSESYARSADPDKTGINLLTKKFADAIAQQDSAALVSLFFSPDSPVIGIMSAKTEQSRKKFNPQFQGLSVATARQFAGTLIRQFHAPEERITNLVVQQDSTLAQLHFLYTFWEKGQLLQWGKEHWSLVWAEGQWLITSVNYLIREAAIEPIKAPSSRKK